MENSTIVRTRDSLLVLENIESGFDLDEKPPLQDKTKGGQMQVEVGIHQFLHPTEGQERLYREALYLQET